MDGVNVIEMDSELDCHRIESIKDREVSNREQSLPARCIIKVQL